MHKQLEQQLPRLLSDLPSASKTGAAHWGTAAARAFIPPRAARTHTRKAALKTRDARHASLHKKQITVYRFISRKPIKTGQGREEMFYEVRKMNMSSIAARSAEIEAVIRLAFADVAEEFHLTPTNCPKHPSFLSGSDLLEPLSLPGVIRFGALMDDVLVGFVAIWPKERGVYELTRLCVLPEHRHAGLGSKLVQAAVQAAQAIGARKIVIGIIAENNRLKRWYERHGFRATAVREYAHLPFSVREMELELFADTAQHYDLLVDEGNDPVNDPPALQNHMDSWDGPRFVDCLRSHAPESVLEIGVGTGRLALRILNFCDDFTGIDISPKSIAAAHKHLRLYTGVKLICGDYLSYVFERQFDAIYSSLTFLHISDKTAPYTKHMIYCIRTGYFCCQLTRTEAERWITAHGTYAFGRMTRRGLRTQVLQSRSGGRQGLRWFSRQRKSPKSKLWFPANRNN